MYISEIIFFGVLFLIDFQSLKELSDFKSNCIGHINVFIDTCKICHFHDSSFRTGINGFEEVILMYLMTHFKPVSFMTLFVQESQYFLTW